MIKQYIEQYLQISLCCRDRSKYSEKRKLATFLCWPPWLIDEEISAFRLSKKAKITLENITSWQDISIRVVARNSGLGGARLKSEPFLSCKSKRGVKQSNVASSC